jgi:uncharacterized protein
MTDESKRQLLAIARQRVGAAVSGQTLPEIRDAGPELQGKQGCFVTLKNGHRLRGCLGNFVSDQPLFKLVADMAVSSATEDPRFVHDPITQSEVPQLTIEISVLSPMKKIANPLDMKLGVDGIYVRRGWAAGCFLPQVATETGWSKEEFLSYCCAEKAGLSADAWKKPGTDVFTFTAEVFSEDELGKP